MSDWSDAKGAAVDVMYEGPGGDLSARAADGFPAVWLRIRVWRVWHLPRFVAAISPVVEQARRHPGMVRFGFEVSWRRLQFSTFGAFDTEASMRDFVDAGPHGAIFHRLRGRLGDLAVRYGTVAAADLPARWDDVPLISHGGVFEGAHAPHHAAQD